MRNLQWLCFPPSSFGQANLDPFEKLLDTIRTWVQKGASFAEYYSGAGAIGLVVAEKASLVRCCEINPQVQECFEQAQSRLHKETAKKISWQNGPSSQFIPWLETCDYFVVDPPKKGIEEKFLRPPALLPKSYHLIYMSCGWPSFKRDAEILCASGWRLIKGESHLFFPGVNH